MASTFSNLKIQLMATGENSGTWGNTTNVNLGTAIEQALVETATVTFASGNVTLTLTDSNSAQNARALRLNLAGTTGGARDLIVPAIQKPYIVNNGTADIITVKVAGQTGIAVPASTSMLLYNNGTDVGLAFNRVVANVVGNVTGDVTGNVTGTASNATVLQTARNIQISGGATAANVSFNGSAAVNLNVTAINVSAASAGTLAVARGGTNQTTFTNGELLIGNTTGNTLTKATLTQGTGITITNGPGSITIAASGAGGLNSSQRYNSPATFTAPPTTNAVYVVVQGGGGGGSGGINANSLVGSFGGSGALAFGVVPVSGGSNYAVTVGGGGAGGNPPSNNSGGAGATGGTSSFSNLISAGGGGGAGSPGANNVGVAGSGGNATAPTGVALSAVPAIPGSATGPIGPFVSLSFGGGGNRGSNNAPNTGGVGGAGYVFVAF